MKKNQDMVKKIIIIVAIIVAGWFAIRYVRRYMRLYMGAKIAKTAVAGIADRAGR